MTVFGLQNEQITSSTSANIVTFYIRENFVCAVTV